MIILHILGAICIIAAATVLVAFFATIVNLIYCKDCPHKTECAKGRDEEEFIPPCQRNNHAFTSNNQNLIV